jgi:hypothetical protein
MAAESDSFNSISQVSTAATITFIFISQAETERILRERLEEQGVRIE